VYKSFFFCEAKDFFTQNPEGHKGFFSTIKIKAKSDLFIRLLYEKGKLN